MCISIIYVISNYLIFFIGTFCADKKYPSHVVTPFCSFRSSSMAKEGKNSRPYLRSLIGANAQPERVNSLRSDSTRLVVVSLRPIAHFNEVEPANFAQGGFGNLWFLITRFFLSRVFLFAFFFQNL